MRIWQRKQGEGEEKGVPGSLHEVKKICEVKAIKRIK